MLNYYPILNGLPQVSLHGADKILDLTERMRRRYFHRQLRSYVEAKYLFTVCHYERAILLSRFLQGFSRRGTLGRLCQTQPNPQVLLCQLARVVALPAPSPCATPQQPRHFEYHFRLPTFRHGDLDL